MNDMMTFPDTVEEFMEDYKVVDTDQVYSNGTEFVPIFRMKQWFEHLPSAQPEPCEDAISRQAAIDMIANNHYSLKYCIDHHIEFSIDVSLAIAKLSELPSVQPEIIRCKDCIAYQEGIDIDGKPFTRCNGSIRTYGHTLPDWFCADAERRTDERQT